jgi:hypothetical protein
MSDKILAQRRVGYMLTLLKPIDGSDTRFALFELETRNTDSLTLGEKMKNLKRLGVSVTLMCLLAGVALAGETSAPPCAAPGETSAPPCAAQIMSADTLAAGETNAPSVSNTTDAVSLSEVALDLVQSVLLLF